MTITMLVLAVLLQLALLPVAQAPSAASENACAVCHLRLAWTQSALTHADQWVTSRHAWSRVGCEQCHGGDATTTDERAAHRGLVNSADPASAVSRASLPTTCGRCHAAETAAFAHSAHRELLAQGHPSAPTCTSCHTSMAADVPSAVDLERQCRRCHRDEHDDRAGIARQAVDAVTRLRRTLNRAKFQIAGAMPSERRAALTAHWTAAEASRRSVLASLHSFDLAQAEARVQDAKAKTDELVAELKE